jgi:hypothetical protein
VLSLIQLRGKVDSTNGEIMKRIEKITLHVGHVVDVEVTTLLEDVIQHAKQSRSMGMTKVDAIRQIYPRIANLPRESIWYVIIHGVNLSSRGAVTYYYNMRHEYS